MSTNLLSNRAGIPMGFFIVADGMGGHEHGEIASELAVQAMVSHVLPEITPAALGEVPDFGDKKLQSIMSEGVQSAHKSIQENASGGGSTLTGLLVLGRTITIAHIGDSRAYHFDGENTLQVLTTDHSLVKRLEDLGQITADEAAIHPQRNVLYRALGQVDQVDADIISTALPSSGCLVVCSDGLWGVVSDQEISRIITSEADPQRASNSLLKAANAAGGPDNISVIIIKIPD
jgi:serine/threonine protein phosphatase PrpC